jgi:outer membrane protein OmpA-like peptidoglycan-associated protein
VGLLHTTCFLSAATVVFATSTAFAQGAAPAQPAPAQPTPAGQPEAGASGSVNVSGGSTGFSFGGGADANAPSGGDAGGEKEWVGWNTGGEDASYGLGMLGHLGLGYRIGDVSVGEAVSRTGLRIGITGIVRLNRYFGLGFGYEHADADHNNVDLASTTAGVETFQDIYRDLNSLWLQARFYPVRIDPVAVYIGLAGGPTWESLSSSTAVVDVNTQQQLVTRCNGSSSVGLGLRGGVGAEFTYVSGAMMFAEIGPDYYAMSEDVLDGCAVGAGSVPQFGFRAGFGFGMEKTRKKYEPVDEPPADRDGDGIPDANDACPEVVGVADADPLKHGCPPDRDADGVLDQSDACPNVPGVASADPAKNGCPPPGDRDGDGVTDDVDACPDLAGVADADPAKNGCPPDTDGDGFRDDQDACPEEKGVDDPDPTKRGCPKLVRVTDKEIVILEQVQFDTGKATIKPESDELLTSVANVLKEHPEILKLEVQGHTDNRGSKQLNKKLSQDRAESVKKALESRGVEATRLLAHGYGPDKPIADNGTEEGRQQNRRVQFVVTEKKAKAPRLMDAAAGAAVAPAAPAAPATPAP